MYARITPLEMVESTLKNKTFSNYALSTTSFLYCVGATVGFYFLGTFSLNENYVILDTFQILEVEYFEKLFYV